MIATESDVDISMPEGNNRDQDTPRRRRRRGEIKFRNIIEKIRSREWLPSSANWLEKNDPQQQGGRRGSLASAYSSESGNAPREMDDVDPYYAGKFGFGQYPIVFSPIVLGCVSRQNPLRSLCIAIVRQLAFEAFILIIILANTILMALYDPVDAKLGISSRVNTVIKDMEWLFISVFTVEALIKIIAQGLFVRPSGYFRETWNWLDFIIALMGWIPVVISAVTPASNSRITSALTVFRMIRVLRPLRTLQFFPGLRNLVKAILGAAVSVGAVLLLCVSIMLVFSIVGITLFKGKLRQHCGVEVDNRTGTWAIPADEVDSFCSLNPENHGRACPEGLTCIVTDFNPSNGLVSFDNLGLALLTVLQAITEEGWSDTMYSLFDTTYRIVGIYFILLILFGSYIMVNLLVSALSVNYMLARKEDRHNSGLESQRRHFMQEVVEMAEKRNQSLKSFLRQPLQKQIREMEMRLVYSYEEHHHESNYSLVTENMYKRYSMRNVAYYPRFRRRIDKNLKQSALFRNRASTTQYRIHELIHSSRALSAQEDNNDAAVGPDNSSVQKVPTMRNKYDSRENRFTRFQETYSSLHDLYHDKSEDALTHHQLQSLDSIEDREMNMLEDRSHVDEEDTKNNLATSLAEIELSKISFNYNIDDIEISEEERRNHSRSLSSDISSMTDYFDARERGFSLGSAHTDSDRFLDTSELRVETRSLEQQQKKIENHMDCEQQQQPRRPPLKGAGAIDSSTISKPSITEPSGMLSRSASEEANLNPDDLSSKPGWVPYGEKPNAPRICIWLYKYIAKQMWFKLFALSLILLNTIVLASEYFLQPNWLTNLQNITNVIFLVLFTLETFIRLIAEGAPYYFHYWFNRFDCFIIFMGYMELFLEGNVASVFRLMRILRFFKLAHYWPTFRDLIASVDETVKQLFPFLIFFGIFLYIFTVSGMQLLGGRLTIPLEIQEVDYVYPSGIDPPASALSPIQLNPDFDCTKFKGDFLRTLDNGTEVWHCPERTNYDTFLWSLVTSFQVISGENWNSVMALAVDQTGQPAFVLYYVFLILFGSYIVLNFFLAILVDTFVEMHVQRKALKKRRRLMKALRAASRMADSEYSESNEGSAALPTPSPTPRASVKSRGSLSTPIITSPTTTTTTSTSTASGSLTDICGSVSTNISTAPATAINGSLIAIEEHQPVVQSVNSLPGAALPSLEEGIVSLSPLGEDYRNQSSRSLSRESSPSPSSPTNDRLQPLPRSTSERLARTIAESLRLQRTGSHKFGSDDGIGSFTSNTPRVKAKKTASLQDVLEKKNQKVYNLSEAEVVEMKAFRYNSLFFISPQNRLRVRIAILVSKAWFDFFVLLVILWSCIILALDTPTSDLDDKSLKVMNIVITAVFVVEAFLKIFAFGFIQGEGSYLRNWWNVLDFTITIISVIDISIPSTDTSTLHVLRALRAIRPLRAIRKFEGLRIVFTSFTRAIIPCAQVLALCLVFYIVFSICSTTFFVGKFHACYTCTSDSDDPLLETCLRNFSSAACHLYPEYDVTEAICPKERQCMGTILLSDGTNATLRWLNPTYGSLSEYDETARSYSFDSFGESLLLLFEVSSMEMWMEPMYYATDSTTIGHDPVRGSNDPASLFFIVFLFVLQFFMLQVFVAVLIDTYFDSADAERGDAFMTPEQRSWVNYNRRALARPFKPHAKLNIPIGHLRKRCYRVVTSESFEWFITIIILSNTILLMTDHSPSSDAYDLATTVFDTLFGIIYIAEATMKIIGLGPRAYFTLWSNNFDFVIVLAVILNWVVTLVPTTANEAGHLLQAIEAIRVLRVMRLLQRLPPVRPLLSTLLYTMYPLLNTLGIIFLFNFIYAILGIQLFGSIDIDAFPADDMQFLSKFLNFENFLHAFLTLFVMSTGESWNGVMHDLAHISRHAVWFCVSYVVIMQLLLVNLFVAVVLASFASQFERSKKNSNEHIDENALKDYNTQWNKVHISYVNDLQALYKAESKKVGPDHPPTNYEKIAQLLEHARSNPLFIPATKFPDLMLRLKAPLGFRKRSKKATFSLTDVMRYVQDRHIPVTRDGMIHFHATLRALIDINVLQGQVPEEIEKFLQIKLSSYTRGVDFVKSDKVKREKHRAHKRAARKIKQLGALSPVFSKSIRTPTSLPRDQDNSRLGSTREDPNFFAEEISSQSDTRSFGSEPSLRRILAREQIKKLIHNYATLWRIRQMRKHGVSEERIRLFVLETDREFSKANPPQVPGVTYPIIET